MAHYAPGMRLIIRDEEWLVKRVDKNSFGSYTLTVNGLSRLVKDKESIFISELDETKQKIILKDIILTNDISKLSEFILTLIIF